MAVIGGVGHVWGAIVGAGLIRVLEDQLQVLLPKLIGTSGSYEVIVFGIALVVVLKYLPDGLWSLVGRHLPKAPRKVDWADATALPERAKPATGDAGARRAEGTQAVRRPGRGERHQLPDPRRPDRRPDRPQRRGQVDHLQPDHRRAARHQRRGAVPGRQHRRPALARDCAAGHGAHLPARQDDSRHDGAGKRGAGRAHARPQGRARRPCCAPTVPKNSSLLREAQRQLERIGMGALPARAGRQPGHGPAAPDGDRARPVRRPGPAAARRARRRPAPPGKAGPGRRAAPAARARA